MLLKSVNKIYLTVPQKVKYSRSIYAMHLRWVFFCLLVYLFVFVGVKDSTPQKRMRNPIILSI